MWAVSAVGLLVVVTIPLLLMVIQGRREKTRTRRMAEMRADGRLPDDVQRALQRATRRTRTVERR